MFTQSDETFHYIRAYQIADGHLISKYDSKGRGTDKLPKSIKTTIFDDKDKYPEYRTYADTDKALGIKLDKNVKSKTYIHCASYVFLDYIQNKADFHSETCCIPREEQGGQRQVSAHFHQ